MRLENVTRGHALPKKLILGIIRLMSGMRAPDVVRVLFYRPDFFGDPFNAWTQAVLRGVSDWSVGERELFAAFVSKKNQCRF